jgi:hypothetical protein
MKCRSISDVGIMHKNRSGRHKEQTKQWMCHITRRQNKIRSINKYIRGNIIRERNPYSNKSKTKLAVACIHIMHALLLAKSVENYFSHLFPFLLKKSSRKKLAKTATQH